MKLSGQFFITKNNLADKRQFNFRLQSIFSVIGLPLFALYVAINFGHFVWGDFYRIWLWLLSVSFIMQLGSVQMLVNEHPEFKLDELQEGFRTRIVLLIFVCILLFFLKLSLIYILVMICFLIFRFAGDSLLAYQSSFGSGTRTLRAELIFWLTLLLCLLLFKDSISTLMLMQSVTVASLTRLIAADVTLLKYLTGNAGYSPDAEWFRAAINKFLPVISAFLFYYTDLMLASILLPVIEFSYYQVTMVCILLPVLILSIFNNSVRVNKLSYVFWFAFILLFTVITYFVLIKFAGVPLTRLYFIFAICIGMSRVITTNSLRIISGSRNYNSLHLISFGTTIFYFLTFPWVLRSGVLENYFIYQSFVHIILALICLIFAWFCIKASR